MHLEVARFIDFQKIQQMMSVDIYELEQQREWGQMQSQAMMRSRCKEQWQAQQGRKAGSIALSSVSPNWCFGIWCHILKNPINGIPDYCDITSNLVSHWSDLSGFCIISWNPNLVKLDPDQIRHPDVLFCHSDAFKRELTCCGEHQLKAAGRETSRQLFPSGVSPLR